MDSSLRKRNRESTPAGSTQPPKRAKGTSMPKSPSSAREQVVSLFSNLPGRNLDQCLKLVSSTVKGLFAEVKVCRFRDMDLTSRTWSNLSQLVTSFGYLTLLKQGERLNKIETYFWTLSAPALKPPSNIGTISMRSMRRFSPVS